MCAKPKVVDAGDAVRAELREHEQALLEKEEAEREVAGQAKLHVRLLVTLLSLLLSRDPSRKEASPCRNDTSFQ